MHREGKKEMKMHSKKFAKPDIIREQEMEKRPSKSTLNVDTHKAP